MLTIGQKVRMDEKGRKNYINRGWFIIQSLSKDRIYLKKEGSGYIESVAIWDLRRGYRRFVTEDKKLIRFKSLLNVKQIEQKQIDKTMTEYRETVGRSYLRMVEKTAAKRAEKVSRLQSMIDNRMSTEDIAKALGYSVQGVRMAVNKYGLKLKEEGSHIMKMTKADVLVMAATGKTPEEIVSYYIDGDESKRSMYTSKVALFLNGPKEKSEGVTKQEIQQKAPKMPSTLKTRLIEDTETGMKFELEDDVLVMVLKEELEPVRIEWDKLDYHVSVLMKLKQIHEAV